MGIGASAGGLEALKDLLRALPVDTGMAFAVVQHLDPTHESLAPGILSRVTKMPVSEVRDGVRVEPNRVYMIPPNCDMALLHGVLTLLPIRARTRGQQVAVDSFLQSLALDQKGRAIGVILSGTGADGTLGLKAIKAEGGLAIVQDPGTAKYGGMPESAIASGLVDLILPPAEIAKELARISRHPYVATARVSSGSNATDDGREGDIGVSHGLAESLRKIFVLLRGPTHVDFSQYKHSTIVRRIQRRMMVRRSESIDAYLKVLQRDPGEIKALYADILIHVTEFFRDPHSFDALREKVFPQIVKGRKPDAAIRIWVPGCSTGEEAYSIAIILLEFLRDVGAKVPVQIFATDICEQSVQKARAGFYPQSIEGLVNKERLAAFFDKVDGGYKVSKAVRDLCLFSRHDATSDPPFSRLDLVSCRNVLIYFSASLQKRVVPIFHYALNTGGFLFLGRSEGLGENAELFHLIDKTHRIFSKVSMPTPMAPRASMFYEPGATPASPRAAGQARIGNGFLLDADRVALSRYAPPSVTVNAEMEILRFQGRTAPCLEPSPGQPSSHLFKMVRQELARGLRSAVLSATKRNEPARVEGLSLEVDGRRRHFNIEVIPANPSSPAEQRSYVIFFEETPPSAPSRPTRAPRGEKGHKERRDLDENHHRISELEADLAASRQLQSSLAEEYAATQEELTSANEELQSINEELQSANEELETSKEELQSSNEELTTVNDELQSRNTELVALGSDLSNVLTNAEIPIVIVGGDRRIRRFTPKAERIFNLIPGDVGRPITDIKPNFDGDLGAMVSEAHKSLDSQEREVRLGDGRWMRVQVRPYRTVDDRIDGAVITLVDITALKEHLTESQTALRYATSVADTLSLPLVVLDEQLHLLSANRGFGRMFEVVPGKDIGSDLMTILGGRGWDTTRLRQLLSSVFGEGKELKDFEVEHDFPELGRRILLLNARRIRWQGTMPKALLLSIDDITERRTLERALEHSEERFRRVVESAHDAIIIVSAKGVIEFVNQRTLAFFGYEAGELEGLPLETLIPERYRAAHRESQERYVAAPYPRPMGAGLELFGRRKDGSEIPVDITLSPIRYGAETRVTAIIRNISETKRLSIERKTLLDQEKEARSTADHAKLDAEIANSAKDVFLATLSHELRTPLSSILSWAQLIQRSAFDPGKLRKGIQAIEQSARIQGQLIDDLLDVARIQSGKLSVSFSEIDPREPIKNAIESVQYLASRKNVAIELEKRLKLETVWADPERLQQIVWNLLSNAIKFSSAGGTVLVRVECVAGDQGKKLVSIQVIDRGKGIQADFLPKLFERFSQADSSSIRVHGGLGLGLALVRDLTQLHAGTVCASSEGLGKGSTFTVLLPVKSELAGKNLGASSNEKGKVGTGWPDLAGLRIMIVEDDPSTMEALSETLISFGAKTIACPTVALALTAFAPERPDLVVSDIAMPGEDGYSLIRKIRELGPDRNGEVPALALTAYAAGADLERALAAGFNAHMPKPFDTFRLGHALAMLAKKATL